MGTISYTVPVAGSDLNSVADPEVATALSTILTWANGNIDGSNLDLTSLSTSNGLTRLAVRTVTTSVTAAASDLIVTSSSGVIVTLPSATANAVVGVVASSGGAMSGSAPVEIAGSNIYCQGASAASLVKLGTPGSYLVLQCDGTNWFAIAGEQNTGWVSLSLSSNIGTVSGCYVPAVRIHGDTVSLCGAMKNNTGSTDSGTLANLPSSAYTPASNATINAGCSNTSIFGMPLNISSSGTTLDVGAAGVPSGAVVTLDGCSYRLR